MDIKQRLIRMQEGIRAQDGFQWDEFAAVCRDALSWIVDREASEASRCLECRGTGKLIIETADCVRCRGSGKDPTGPYEIRLDDPESTPAMEARQIRYQECLAVLILAELKETKLENALCMINALTHHLVMVVRILRTNDVLKADTVDRMLKRFEILLRLPTSKGGVQ